MNIGEKIKRSRAAFKLAIEHIKKHRLPITPPNYELWYHYVNKTIPRLNREIDHNIGKFGSVSSFQCQELYRKYLARRAESELEHLKSTIEQLATEAKSSMSNAVEDTLAFEGALNQIIDDCAKIKSKEMTAEQISNLFVRFVNESSEMKASASSFKSQLISAQDEIDQLQEKLKELEKEVMLDSLTSLPNRRAFDEDMAKYLEAQKQFSVAVLDVDKFKSFNDTYGHLMGDRVLIAVALRLKKPGIKGVKAYRIGGEEFAVIMPGADIKFASVICESLRKSIERISIKQRDSNEVVKNISASFGVTKKVGDDIALTIMERADKLLYKAKDAGRNIVMTDEQD